MEVFYKGEDIVLELSLFTDEYMDIPISLDGYIVDIVLYCNGSQNAIICSSRPNTGNVPLVMSDLRNRCVIPRSLLESMSCGVFTVEVRLVDKIDNTSRIVKKYAFTLEDTFIKNL